jgi:hypothetical protein
MKKLQIIIFEKISSNNRLSRTHWLTTSETLQQYSKLIFWSGIDMCCYRYRQLLVHAVIRAYFDPTLSPLPCVIQYYQATCSWHTFYTFYSLQENQRVAGPTWSVSAVNTAEPSGNTELDRGAGARYTLLEKEFNFLLIMNDMLVQILYMSTSEYEWILILSVNSTHPPPPLDIGRGSKFR